MATIYLSALLNRIKGRLGDVVFVWRHGKVVAMLSPTVFPHPESYRTEQIKNNISYLSKQWDGLSLEIKQLWQSRSVQKGNSNTGYNEFMSLNSTLLHASHNDLTMINYPPHTPSTPRAVRDFCFFQTSPNSMCLFWSKPLISTNYVQASFRLHRNFCSLNPCFGLCTSIGYRPFWRFIETVRSDQGYIKHDFYWPVGTRLYYRASSLDISGRVSPKTFEQFIYTLPFYGFLTEWVVAGDATARTITLPLIQSRAEGALSYNCIVKWGDGSADSTVTSYDDADRIHTYANDGTYQIEIVGTCEGFSFNNAGDKLKITKVVSWGNSSFFNGFKYLANGFYGCTNLNSLAGGGILPSGTGILVDGFNSTFQNCINLTSLPTDLFRYNTTVSNYGFGCTFSGCTGLVSLPTDLFRYNTAVSNYGFYATFYSCTALISLPTDLFRYNTAVSNYGFQYTFYNCTSLTSLPTDLFKYNTAVSNYGFYATFYNCTNLTSLPTDLFRYNTTVSNYGFYATFYNCIKLQLNAWIFYSTGEEGTRFLNKVSSFELCFYRPSFNGIQGTAPALWDCVFGTETPTKTNCYAGAGNSTTSLTNYADIPLELMTINVSPVTDWAKGDIITGQTSGKTCIIVAKVSATTYQTSIPSGIYTDGEVIGVTGNNDKLADQNAGAPVFTALWG